MSYIQDFSSCNERMREKITFLIKSERGIEEEREGKERKKEKERVSYIQDFSSCNENYRERERERGERKIERKGERELNPRFFFLK